MTVAFDSRLVTVSLQLSSGTVEYSGVAIFASGRKYDSSIQAQCEVTIYNLTSAQINNILTQASPLKLAESGHVPVNMILSVGRESYGTFILFQGDVITSDITQPPDIGVTLSAINSQGALALIVSNNQSSIATLQTISNSIADSLGLALDFQANDKQIDNYSFTGAALKQVEKLNQMGGIKACIDDTAGTLVVMDAGSPRTGAVVQVNANTGMVGIPQVTQFGVIVRLMINPQIRIGGQVQITSQINPAANGTYIVTQINFEVANRDQPFWYTLSCSSPSYYLAGTQ